MIKSVSKKHCFLFISFLLLPLSAMADTSDKQIIIDFNHCKALTQSSFSWGLGSISVSNFNLKEGHCYFQLMNEVEGGYFIKNCSFPQETEQATICVSESCGNNFSFDNPNCKEIKTGNLLLEAVRSTYPSERPSDFDWQFGLPEVDLDAITPDLIKQCTDDFKNEEYEYSLATEHLKLYKSLDDKYLFLYFMMKGKDGSIVMDLLTVYVYSKKENKIIAKFRLNPA